MSLSHRIFKFLFAMATTVGIVVACGTQGDVPVRVLERPPSAKVMEQCRDQIPQRDGIGKPVKDVKTLVCVVPSESPAVEAGLELGKMLPAEKEVRYVVTNKAGKLRASTRIGVVLPVDTPDKVVELTKEYLSESCIKAIDRIVQRSGLKVGISIGVEVSKASASESDASKEEPYISLVVKDNKAPGVDLSYVMSHWPHRGKFYPFVRGDTIENCKDTVDERKCRRDNYDRENLGFCRAFATMVGHRLGLPSEFATVNKCQTPGTSSAAAASSPTPESNAAAATAVALTGRLAEISLDEFEAPEGERATEGESERESEVEDEVETLPDADRQRLTFMKEAEDTGLLDADFFKKAMFAPADLRVILGRACDAMNLSSSEME